MAHSNYASRSACHSYRVESEKFVFGRNPYRKIPNSTTCMPFRVCWEMPIRLPSRMATISYGLQTSASPQAIVMGHSDLTKRLSAKIWPHSCDVKRYCGIGDADSPETRRKGLGDILRYRLAHSHAEDVLWLAHAGISTGWRKRWRIYVSWNEREVKRQDMSALHHRLAIKGSTGCWL